MGRDQRCRAINRRNLRRLPCVYCGTNPAGTVDHVPPQCLFPKPRVGLIEVPCCEVCKESQSADDEYFKSTIVLRHDVADEPLARPVVDSVIRAFAYPEGRGFAARLMQSVREVKIRTLAGLYVGRGATFNVDLQRLDRVVRRTLQGLYFRETDVRLPDTHQATVWSAAGLQNLNAQQQASLERIVKIGTSGKIRVIGDGVFTYAFQGIAVSPHCSVWLFLFYRRVAFIGFTVRREDLA